MKQQVNKSTEKFVRYTLGVLLFFVALNAFAGGYYGMAGAENVPKIWLKGSPFRSYFIPSLVLFIVIGDSALAAAIAVFRQLRLARKVAFISGIIILLWLMIQVAMIGYVSWMQPTTAIVTIIILLLIWHLPKYDD